MTIFPGAIWIEFDNPAWLLALAVVFTPLLLAIWASRRGRRASRIRVFLQFVALLLAVVSLAAPVVPSSMHPPRWLVLQDVSASVGRQAEVDLNLPTGVAFERHSFAEDLGRQDRDATRLGPVLEWAGWSVRAGQADGAIVVTDGQFQDDWLPAARDYAKTRAPLWIVPLDAPPADARIEAFAARRERPMGTSPRTGRYDISVTVAANAAGRRVLTVFRILPSGEKRSLGQSEVALEPDRPATIHFRDSLPADSPAVWQAELTPHDALPQNDTYKAASLSGNTRVAWLAGRSAVAIPGVEIASLFPAEAPADISSWLGYNCVVLADAMGKLLSAQQRSALAEYVRSGGGLVLLGAGPHAKPADRADPLNRILPLIANPFERNPLHLTVVLDASGSMAQLAGSPAQPKWSLATEAVLALREHLTPADRLRVIVFSDGARTIYNTGPAGADFPALADALRGVRPNGPTNIAPALEQVLQASPPQDATNLVLILSDLQAADFDPAAFAKRLKEQGRKIAIVATGSVNNETTPLAQLARRLGAPLIYREHLQGLADVFANLCRQSRGDVVRRSAFVVRYDSAWPEAARVQRLGAYIPAVTAGEDRVDARIEQTNDPLIAAGLAGWGKAVVVSAPPQAVLPQPAAGKLLAELISRAARSANDPRFDVQTTRSAGRLHVRITVREDDKAVNNLSLRVKVLALPQPASEADIATCSQTGPGVYETDLPLTEKEQALAVRVEKSDLLRWQGVVPANYPAEFARLGAEYETLRELAERTGGRIVELAALRSPEMQNELRRPRRLGREIWRMTFTGAVIAMLSSWIVGFFRKTRKTRKNMNKD